MQPYQGQTVVDIDLDKLSFHSSMWIRTGTVVSVGMKWSITHVLSRWEWIRHLVSQSDEDASTLVLLFNTSLHNHTSTTIKTVLFLSFCSTGFNPLGHHPAHNLLSICLSYATLSHQHHNKNPFHSYKIYNIKKKSLML